jgi:hypothetical protein
MTRPSVRAQWPTYQGDIQHTGSTTATVDPSQITVAWQAPQGYGVPLIVGNAVYSMRNQQGIGTDSTTIQSFNATNGSVNWTYTGQFSFPGEPTYSNGSLYFLGRSGIGASPILHVLDANTGTQRYQVPLPNMSGCGSMPIIYTAPNGSQTALIIGASDINTAGTTAMAVSLGATSGSTLWQSNGTNIGSGCIPTVIGNSVIAVGPGHFYSFDLTTGSTNQFLNGNINGGGGGTVVADAARNRFFIQQAVSTSVTTALTAYTYTNNSTITQLWQRTDGAIQSANGVAVAGTGLVYTVNDTTLLELNGSTGATLRSLPGRAFPRGSTPVISNGKIWVYETVNNISGVSAFDLNTLTFDKFFSGGRGNLNSAFQGPGAFATGLFAEDSGNVYGFDGFKMLMVPVPEPTVLALLCGGVAGGATVIHRRRRSPPAESRRPSSPPVISSPT